MLVELVVESLGVIERADVVLGPGSTALTGETGAGKTLVVAAVGLLLGGRADRSIVRTGATEARVEGRFLLPSDHPAAVQAAALGVIEDGDGKERELIVTRTLGGSSKARINGRLVTMGQLAEIVSQIVEIAGQNEHQRLSGTGVQRIMLDTYTGDEAVTLSGRVAEQVRAALVARQRSNELADAQRERARELDVLRAEIGEIESAGLNPGEAERLSVDAHRLENAEAMAANLQAAIDALREEGGAEDALGIAEQRLRAIGPEDPEVAALAVRLEAARIEVADVAADLNARIVQPDPQALEEMRTRLDVIAKLRRKYGDTESEVLEYLDRARARAAELDGAEHDAGAWALKAQEATAEAMSLAGELSSLRAEAAQRLSKEVGSTLGELALDGARFEVDLSARELYEGGLETVAFKVSANRGEEPKPLAKAASGGELSRIALALHLACSKAVASTLIFDEVDAGVGGVAAQSVGRALADLARDSGAQVLVVTHLPQVAAFADNHLVVTKEMGAERTTARVEELDADARVEELSRMLAGLPDSEVGQEHARELLDLASGPSA